MRMELGLSQQQTIKQIQTLSPQMYMSMEILCLNSLDLEDRIETELENNETLEVVEAAPSEAGGEAVEAVPEPKDEAAEFESFEKRVEQWDEYAREEFGSVPRKASTYTGEKDEKLEALSNTEDRPESLQEHLEEQVHLLGDDEIEAIARAVLVDQGRPVSGPDPETGTADVQAEAGAQAHARADLPPVQAVRTQGALGDEEVGLVRDLCEAVIYNISDRGYLMYSLEEIHESLEQKPPIELLRVALAVIQSLEPAGVGGRDLRECLLLQLERDRQDYPLEERIIRHHLEDLGHNRLPKIARALGVTIDEVKEAMDNIASLNPIPGKLFGGERPRYVKPDVVVDEVEGNYEVRVESDYVPRLQISAHYRNLFKESRKNPEVKKYLKKKMDSAEWLILAIRQRQATLQKIAQEIVNIQAGFLDHGISHLKPLKMADVAERLGVHVSTISRAISGKYMQTPRGTFDLKFFFSGGATKDDGNVEARGSVIQRIKDLIAREDKKSPLSDISIVRKLEASGIKISRRTVTKYREAEGIPSSRERRVY